MPRRAVSFRQADITRAIRAMREAGYPDVRVVIRDGAASVEPADVSQGVRKTVAEPRRVVIL